jgi:hypothetical protein
LKNSKVLRQLTVIAVAVAALLSFGVPAFATTLTGDLYYTNRGPAAGYVYSCLNWGLPQSGPVNPESSCIADNLTQGEWKYTDVNGIYTFAPLGVYSADCLAVNSAGTSYFEACSAHATTEEWTVHTLSNGWNFISVSNHMCLGIGNSSEAIEARDCTGTSYQIWYGAKE